MTASAELSRFVRDALTAGKSRAEISQALAQAGWRSDEVTQALSAWDEMVFSPPVPRPQPTVSARDFFIYSLTFGTLLLGAGYLVAVLTSLIDHAFSDDALRYYGDLRWGLAVLIVTVPLYLWLTFRDQRRIAREGARARSTIRRWLTYITLLLASFVLLGDLIAVIYALLNGDLSLQFLLKAGVVVVVAGGIFVFYLSDLRRSEVQ